MHRPHDRVLIVDDNDINLEIIVEILLDEYELQVATRGEVALSIVERRPPDLILLDVVMPGMDGFEVCQRLKASPDTRDIPVIFLTSVEHQHAERRGLRIGAVDFIHKPVNPDLLSARVRNQLELKHHRDRLRSLVAERTTELRRTQEATLASMALLAEFRDNETGHHVQRTKRYARTLVRTMARLEGGAEDLPDEELLYQSAALHDIGKVAIPDSILLKQGPLTSEEFERMKQHTSFGGQVLRRTEQVLGTNSFLVMAREIAEGHHERWDGSGYPLGLEGPEIPMSARIMAVADVYDALVSRRPYKPPFPHDRAVQLILHGDGRTSPAHFCPRVLGSFAACSEQLEDIAGKFPDVWN
jgi:putative two-component system response regulator